MHAVALLLTVAALGADKVQYGWEPAEDGHLVYIIQIAPDLVETLQKDDVDLQNDIPPELQPHIKKIKVRIGTGPVPRKGLEEAQAAAEIAAAKAAQAGAFNTQLPGGAFKPGNRLNTDPRGSPTTAPGGRVLSPLNPNEAPLPNENDRFTEGAASNFPRVGQQPGIGRMASNTRDNPNKFEAAPGDRTPLEYDNQGNPRPATGAANNGYTWDPVTKQWRAPEAAKPPYPTSGIDQQDPRYSPGYPPAGYNQGANYNQPRTNSNWSQPPYNYPAPPLRDPDQGYYPPNSYAGPYDPNYPNRPVGYEQVAAARQPNAPATTPPGAAPVAQPNGATGVGKNAVTPTSARDNMLAREEPPKPWGALTVSLMFLFGSIGLNFYLGWIAHGIYQRYRALLMEVRNVRVAPV
jgi:hypothetical protein